MTTNIDPNDIEDCQKQVFDLEAEVSDLRAALERARALANELQNYAKDKEGEMSVMMAAVAGTMRGIGDRLAALLAPASGGAA